MSSPSLPPTQSRASCFSIANLPYWILGVMAAVSVLSRLYLMLR